MENLVNINQPKSEKTMSSKRIAEKTGKLHSHVLRDIRNMVDELDNPNVDHLNYREIKDSRGYTAEVFLNERLSLCLASGYSIKLRMMIIDDWASMKTQAQLPQDPIILMRLQQIEFDSRLKQVEARITTRPEYFTIAGYGSLKGIPVGLKRAAELGRKASNICKANGYEMDTIPDPRFGRVKLYPIKVLDLLFNTSIA
jgi:hypothetical protein